MGEELTTQPMLEAILEGQRHITSQIVELHSAFDVQTARQDALAAKVDQIAAKLDDLAAKVDDLAAKVDDLAAKVDDLAAKVDDLAARQDRLELRMAELVREVRDGLYYTNRAIEAFNKRMLDYELWLRKVDERLHDEILIRTR
jgi:outer membrane murein-binding lipoprotein Lpp